VAARDLGIEPPDLASADGGRPAGDLALPVVDLARPADLTPVTGHLTGSAGATLALVDLSSEGVIDWAHWGFPVGGDEDHKAAVTSEISYYTTLSGNTATGYANNPSRFAWHDGTLTTTEAGTPTGMYRQGVADGFRITVPASTKSRTLLVFVGGYRSNGKLSVSLSDHSAPDYVDASFSRTDTQIYNVTYTLVFNAAHDGETLAVIWEAASVVMDGNVALEAAALR
jgi:hypothetical protein